MKLFEVLTGSMTGDEATQIFAKYGVDARGLDPTALKAKRKTIIMKHHQDFTGDPTAAQEINAAYDVLSQFGTTHNPTGRYSGAGDGNYYGGNYRSGGGPAWDEYTQEPPKRDTRKETPVWAMAGHSGGAPPNSSIYRSDFTDMNFFKKSIWELSGQSTTPYTIWGFDGHFFRNSLTVFGSPKVFGTMADGMRQWQSNGGNPYDTRAVFITKGKSPALFLIYADGKYYDQNPIPFEHNSFNLNPSNDQQFMHRIPGMLDDLKIKNQL